VSWLPEEAWRRNQYVMVATVFVVFTGFAFVIPFLPLYVRQLGVRSEESVVLWAGVLIGVSPLLAGVLAPLWGRAADRHGQKRTASLVLFAYFVLLLLSAAVTDVWQLLALRVGVGVFGAFGPLGLAMATSLAPPGQMGRAVGTVQAAQILAAAVGPFAGGALADTIGIRWTFVATAAFCAVALGLMARYFREGAEPAPRDAVVEPRASFAEILRVRGVPGLLVVLFLVNFVSRSFTPILPLHLQGLGVPVGRLALSTGVLISVYSVAAAASASALGRASSRFRPRRLLAASLAGSAAAVLPMVAVPTFGGFLLLALLLGLASGGSLTLGYTIGGLLVPTERRTTAFGFLAGAALFGGAISPSVAGLLARWELKAIYLVDAGLLAALAAAVLAGGRDAAPAAPASPSLPDRR
jgi:MFS transporter, DHA1 family, multidrug resistance protein